MSLVIPVGFAQCSIIYQRDGAPRESVTTFGYDPPTTDPVAHASTIDGLLKAADRPVSGIRIQAGWSYMGVRCVEMTDTGPMQGEFFDQEVGLGSGGAMPPNVAVLIRKFTAAGGRRNRGRMFVPPVWPAETNVSPAGGIAGPQVADLQTWWGGFFGALTTAGLPPVLLHSQVPFTPTPITSVSVQVIVATQRRRLRR